MRLVEYYEHKRVEGKLQKFLAGEGVFHKWGVEFEEFESGPGNYSTAIIELDDGTVKNIPVELIKFISK